MFSRSRCTLLAGFSPLVAMLVATTLVQLCAPMPRACAAKWADRPKRLTPGGPAVLWQDMSVVIANRRDPRSLQLAKEYMELRNIPKEQLCVVDCTSEEEISRQEFEQAIWQPVVQYMLKTEQYAVLRDDQIDAGKHMPNRHCSGVVWFILMYGMPLRIAEQYGPGETWHSPWQRNAASVDSELASFPPGPGKLAGPIPNPMFKANEEFTGALHEPDNDFQTEVCRIDGPTYEMARALLDRADTVRKYGLGGDVFIDSEGLKEGIRMPIDQALRRAGDLAVADGMSAHVDTELTLFDSSAFQEPVCAYLGWYAPNVTGPFVLPNFRLQTGAFCYPLHPWSAASLRTTDHFWAGALLAKGAGWVVGNIFDPGLDGYTRPDQLLHSIVNVRRTGQMMHASWSATPYLSWSTVFIGEPTFQPFAGSLEMLGRLRKEKPKDSAEVPLRVLRDILRRTPSDQSVVTRAKEFIEKESWDHPNFYELLGSAWSSRDLWSGDMAVRSYLKVAELSTIPQQRCRARLAAARTILDISDVKLVEYVKGEAPDLFKDDLREVAKTFLEKAVAQDGKDAASLPCSSLLRRLCHEDKQDGRIRQLLEDLAKAYPDRPEGVSAAGELWVLDRARENPMPTLTAARAAVPPQIDGRRTDPCWQAAAEAMPSMMKEIGVGAVASPIQLSATYDAENLYLFLSCSMQPLTESELRGRTEDPLKDSLLILLSPKRDYATAYSIEVDRAGKLRAKADDPSPRRRFQINTVVVGQTNDSWTVELTVPLAQFIEARMEPGEVWGLHFRRQRAITGKDSADTITTSWTGRYGDLDEMDRCGFLEFR